MSIHQISNYNDTSTKYLSNIDNKMVIEEQAPAINDEAAVYEKAPSNK